MGRRNKNRAARRRAELLRGRKQSQLAELLGGIPQNSLPQRSLSELAFQHRTLPQNALQTGLVELDSLASEAQTPSSSTPTFSRIISVVSRLTSRVSSFTSQLTFQTANCKLQTAKCKMQNAKCKIQNANFAAAGC
jgi:hypothetical protein